MRSYIIYIITKYTTQHIFQQLFIDILLQRISHEFRTDNASIRWFFFFFFCHKNSIPIVRSSDYFLKKKSMEFLFPQYFNFRGNGEIIILIGFATNFHCRIVKFILSCIMPIVGKFITAIRNYRGL